MPRLALNDSTITLSDPREDVLGRIGRYRSSAPIGNLATALFTMAIIFAVSVPVIAVLDPGYPALILAVASVAGSLGGWYSARVKAANVERERVDREREVALSNSLELKRVKEDHAELKAQFADFKENAKREHSDIRHDLDVEREKSKNLDATLSELRRRLATHVALITDIGLLVKTGNGTPEISVLITEWHRQNRHTWASGDTP